MDIIMPKMGESVSEGTIIKWHKSPGDSVKRDEIIFEISTDKVDTEIPSPADGVLSEIKVNEGETVEVGTVVGIIETNGSGTAKSRSSSGKDKKQEAEEQIPVSETFESGRETETKKEETETVSTSAAENKSAEKSQGSIVEIAMPKMGESVMEGTIIKWHKKVGESIKKDETLFEISTDKVDTEVPSPSAGILSEILVAEQETVEVGTIVAKLSTGENINSVSPEKQLKTKKETITEPVMKEYSESMHDSFSQNVPVEQPEPDQKQKTGTGFYSPLVLSIVQKENVSMSELEKIKGTGLEGRVTKKDILNYIENKGKQKSVPQTETKVQTGIKAAAPAQQSSKEYVSPGDSVEKIPMDNIRQKIMQHMISSRDTSVHVSAMLEVDMSKINNFIQAKKTEIQKSEGIKLTYMPFIANAVVKALKEFPLVNSTLEGSLILKKKFINLGIAVAIEPAGLIVPNIKKADEKNIIGLAKAISDIAERSRNKKLSPDDISNGTFTITNYGVFGTIFGTPIINQPEVAILGVGAVIKRPVIVEADGADSIAIKPVMALTLSHDHRLIDGMLGGKFLKFIKDSLENFDSNNL